MPIIETAYRPPTMLPIRPRPPPANMMPIARPPATIGSIRSRFPNGFDAAGGGISGGDSSSRSPRGIAGGVTLFGRWNVIRPIGWYPSAVVLGA